MLVVNTFVIMSLVYLVMHLVLWNFGRNMMVLQLSLYYHDNSTDGGKAVDFAYGGDSSSLSYSGAFIDNDNVATHETCCSAALTANIIPFSYYHDVVVSFGTVPIFGVCSNDFVYDYTKGGIFPSSIVGSWEYTDCRGSP